MQLIVLPPVEELQTSPETRSQWIAYSALDAVATYELYQKLQCKLKQMACEMDPAVKASLRRVGDLSQWNLYESFWQPFGELLTDMEKEGFLVDRCFPYLHILMPIEVTLRGHLTSVLG